MPRISTITYEQVALIADTIQHNGSKPTLRAVHEKVGSGSRTTIMKHLQQWHNSHAGQDIDASVVPNPTVMFAINAQIKTKIQEATDELTAKILELQDAQNMLMGENERQAVEVATKDAEIDELKANNANLSGLAQHLKSEIVKLINESASERKAAEVARVDLAGIKSLYDSTTKSYDTNLILISKIDLLHKEVAEIKTKFNKG